MNDTIIDKDKGSSKRRRYNSTVKTPASRKTSEDLSPKSKLLKKLYARVSELGDRIDNLSILEDANGSRVVDVGRCPGRRAALVDSPLHKSTRSEGGTMNLTLRPSDPDDDAILVDDSRTVVEGLRPVPANADLTSIRSALGWSERMARKALRGEFMNLSLITDDVEIAPEKENY